MDIMGGVDQDELIRAFWSYFQTHQAALASAASADTPEYDGMLEALQEIDPGLYFEFSTQGVEREFIVTAEGKRELFPLVEHIVEKAPDVAGWRFFPLKPKLGFPRTTRWENYTLTLDGVAFETLEGPNGELGLLLLVPGLKPEDTEDAHNALLRAIDHGLGERLFAEKVRHTEVAPMPADSEEYIPLAKLEDYIAWRDRRRQT